MRLILQVLEVLIRNVQRGFLRVKAGGILDLDPLLLLLNSLVRMSR